MNRYIYLYFFIPSICISQNCDFFSYQNCLENRDNFYFFEKVLIGKECEEYELDNQERLNLKNSLTESIVSFVENKSSQELGYERSKRGLYEVQIYNSLSQSNSSAILFNPKFLTCRSIKNGNEVNSVFVYIEKENFNLLTINYFKSLIERTKNYLKIYNEKFINDPKYDFFEELIILESNINTLSSYYGLMISLKIEEKHLLDFLKIENELKLFKQKINSFENLLLKSDFNQSFELLSKFNTIYRNTYTNRIIDLQIKNYNELVKIEKSNKLNEFKSRSISYDSFSIELIMNSALINNYRGGSGILNYNNNSTYDRLYPSIGSKFIFNDREHRYGIGPFFKYNFSQILLPLNSIEYYFPFSNQYSEIGLFGQYFFIKIYDENISAITFSVGKMLENFVSEKGDYLNFFSISPGFKTYLQKNNFKKYRTSFNLNFNLIIAKKKYSYYNLSIGLSRDLKVGQKISENEKYKLENEYKIFK